MPHSYTNNTSNGQYRLLTTVQYTRGLGTYYSVEGLEGVYHVKPVHVDNSCAHTEQVSAT